VVSLLYVDRQALVPDVQTVISTISPDFIYCSGVETERSLRSLTAQSDRSEIIEFHAIDPHQDSWLKRELLLLCSDLAVRLVAPGAKATIPQYAGSALAMALADFLFIELRPILMLAEAARARGVKEVVVLPRASAYGPGLRSFLVRRLGVSPKFVLDHLDSARAERVMASAPHPHRISPRAAPRLRTYDFGAEPCASGQPIIVTSLSSARSGALVAPVLARVGELGNATALLNPGPGSTALERIRGQYGIPESVRFVGKSLTERPTPLFRESRDADHVSNALAGLCSDWKTQLPGELEAALTLIANVLRKRIPAVIGDIRNFDTRIRPAVQAAQSVTVSPGLALDSILAVEAAKEADVWTIEIQRGIIAPTTVHAPPAANQVLAIDDQSRDVYVRHLGLAPEAVEVVGSVKLDVDLNAYRGLSRARARSELSEVRGLGERQAFLLVGQPLGPTVMKPVARVVMKAAAALDADVIVKLHPEEGAAAARLYEEVAKETGLARHHVVANEPTAKLICACDGVATYFSTVALEAFALGFPVAAINPFETRPPFDLADLGVAVEFSDAGKLATYFEARQALDASTPALAHLLDGRTAERAADLILGLERGRSKQGGAPILTFAALRSRAREIEAAQGARPAIEFLDSHDRFPVELRQVLAVYPNFSEGAIDAAFRGWCHWPRLDRTVAFPEGLAAWDGELLPRTLVVWAPPGIGIGAEVLHLGFLSGAARAVHRLVLIIDDRLVELVRERIPSLDVRARSKFELDDLDLAHARHTTIMSLGWLARLGSGRYRRERNYLRNKRRSAEVRGRLGRPRRLVGLAWKTTNVKGAWRNVDHLNGLLDALPRLGVTYVCLQHGVDEDERALLETAGILTPQDLDPVGDVPGYLNYVGAMDLVLTTPNSLAHFAGAVGTPVIMLSPEPCVPEWRSDYARNHWYPEVQVIPLDAERHQEAAALHEAARQLRLRLNFFSTVWAEGRSAPNLRNALRESLRSARVRGRFLMRRWMFGLPGMAAASGWIMTARDQIAAGARRPRR
jgi:hypothetical protein